MKQAANSSNIIDFPVPYTMDVPGITSPKSSPATWQLCEHLNPSVLTENYVYNLGVVAMSPGFMFCSECCDDFVNKRKSPYDLFESGQLYDDNLFNQYQIPAIIRGSFNALKRDGVITKKRPDNPPWALCPHIEQERIEGYFAQLRPLLIYSGYCVCDECIEYVFGAKKENEIKEWLMSCLALTNDEFSQYMAEVVLPTSHKIIKEKGIIKD